MAKDITSSDYWSEISSIAENVKEDVRENEGDVSDAVPSAGSQNRTPMGT